MHIIIVRLGNYLKDELGGIYSPYLKCSHPSQIYELVTEGIIESFILWSLYHHLGRGIIFILMPIIYGIFRTLCERFKVEDDGMPNWFRRSLHKYIKFVHFQCICLPIVFFIVFSVTAAAKERYM